MSDRYAQTVAPLLEAYVKKTPRQRYGKDETYIAFRTEIWVRCFPRIVLLRSYSYTHAVIELRRDADDSMCAGDRDRWSSSTQHQQIPPHRCVHPICLSLCHADDRAAEEGEEADSDDEIEIGAQTVDFKCGLTLMFLVEPVISSVSHLPCSALTAPQDKMHPHLFAKVHLRVHRLVQARA